MPRLRTCQLGILLNFLVFFEFRCFFALGPLGRLSKPSWGLLAPSSAREAPLCAVQRVRRFGRRGGALYMPNRSLDPFFLRFRSSSPCGPANGPKTRTDSNKVPQDSTKHCPSGQNKSPGDIKATWKVALTTCADREGSDRFLNYCPRVLLS